MLPNVQLNDERNIMRKATKWSIALFTAGALVLPAVGLLELSRSRWRDFH